MTVNLIVKAKFKAALNFATFENYQVICEYTSGGSRDRRRYTNLCQCRSFVAYFAWIGDFSLLAVK